MRIKLLFLVASVISLRCAEAQIINTIAGNGTSGYSGDGGAAVSASLHNPWQVTLDTLGTIYFVDESNNRIRKIDTTGIITTVAGTGVYGFSGDGGLATSAQLLACDGVAVDSHGNIYIADSGNHRIRKINPAGIISTYAGNGVMGYSGDGGLATLAKLYGPGMLAIDAMDNLYFCDGFNGWAVRKIDPSGIITRVAGKDSAGFSGDGGMATQARIAGIAGITFDVAGNIYLADFNNQRIRRIDHSGIINTIAGTGVAGYGGDGGPALLAELYNPTGIKEDASGNLYISDANNNRIRKIDPLGTITTIVGTGTGGFAGDGGPAINAELWYPYDVAFDKQGNLIIADNANNRIRKVTNVANVVAEDHANYFSTEPNPASESIKVVSPLSFSQIAIRNFLGNEVIVQNLDANKGSRTINISTLPNGIYFVSVIAGSNTSTKKLIVQH
jgi:sugar lactone lactonase YvrE